MISKCFVFDTKLVVQNSWARKLYIIERLLCTYIVYNLIIATEKIVIVSKGFPNRSIVMMVRG